MKQSSVLPLNSSIDDSAGRLSKNSHIALFLDVYVLPILVNRLSLVSATREEASGHRDLLRLPVDELLFLKLLLNNLINAKLTQFTPVV